MVNPARLSPSIKLARSRPVLMIQRAPSACNRAKSDSSFFGTGGRSKSECNVPSKSVDMSLMGKDIETLAFAWSKLARPVQSCDTDKCQKHLCRIRIDM